MQKVVQYKVSTYALKIVKTRTYAINSKIIDIEIGLNSPNCTIRQSKLNTFK